MLGLILLWVGKQSVWTRRGALTGVIGYFSSVVPGAELWGDRLAFASLDVVRLCC